MKAHALLLAAGASSRSGTIHKLLARSSDGTSMAGQAAINLLSCPFISQIVVVTGRDHTDIRKAIENDCAQLSKISPSARRGHNPVIQFCYNKAYRKGISGSIRIGIQALLPPSDHPLFIALADMPHIQSSFFKKMLEATHHTLSWDAVTPVFNHQQGNPVLWHPRHYKGLMHLTGDKGGKSLLQQPDMHIITVPLPAGILRDYDTAKDLKQFTNKVKHE